MGPLYRIIPVDGSAFVVSQVTTAMENVSVTRHALFESAHDFKTVIRNSVATVKVHFAIMSSVSITHDQTGSVVLDVAVIALVAGQLTQETTLDLAVLWKRYGSHQ